MKQIYSMKKHPRISSILHIAFVYILCCFLYTVTAKTSLDKITAIILVISEGLDNGLAVHIDAMVKEIDSGEKSAPIEILGGIFQLLIALFINVLLIVTMVMFVVEVIANL